MATKPLVGTEPGDGAGVDLPASDIRSAPVSSVRDPGARPRAARAQRRVARLHRPLRRSRARSTSRSSCASSTTASVRFSGAFPGTPRTNWLPFLMVVTVLVFWQAGLYAPRERRAGAGRIVSSLLLVTSITLAFSVGTGYQHSTFGLYVTALRARRDRHRTAARELRGRDRRPVARRRRPSARAPRRRGRAARVAPPRNRPRPQRHRLRVRRRARVERARRTGCPSSAASPTSTRILAEHRPDELIVSGAGLRRAASCSTSSRRRTAPASRCASRRRRPSCSRSAPSTCRDRAFRCSSCGRRCSPGSTGRSSARSTSS